MALADKQNGKVTAFVTPSLQPGERIQAVLGQAMANTSIKWAFLSPIVQSFQDKPFGLVMTDQRLILVRLAKKLTGYPPAEIVASYPRGQVKLVSWDRGTMSGRLTIALGGAEPVAYRIATIYRDGAELVVDTIEHPEAYAAAAPATPA